MKVELYDTYRKVEATHWWFVARRAIIMDMLFQKYSIGASSRILDVGCNYGYFVGDLQKKGYTNAYGTDISAEAIEYGKQQGIHNLSVATADRLPFPEGGFEATLALDVIEHIEDDRAALKEIARVTKKGGYFFVMVPAYMWMWSLQDEVALHFRRYTKKTFRAAAEGSGFRIVGMTYFNTLLFAPIVLIRMLERLMKVNRSSDFELNNAFTNTVLKAIFGLEAHLLRFIKFPFGVSLLVVLQKE